LVLQEALPVNDRAVLAFQHFKMVWNLTKPRQRVALLGDLPILRSQSVTCDQRCGAKNRVTEGDSFRCGCWQLWLSMAPSPFQATFRCLARLTLWTAVSKFAREVNNSIDGKYGPQLLTSRRVYASTVAGAWGCV